MSSTNNYLVSVSGQVEIGNIRFLAVVSADVTNNSEAGGATTRKGIVLSLTSDGEGAALSDIILLWVKNAELPGILQNTLVKQFKVGYASQDDTSEFSIGLATALKITEQKSLHTNLYYAHTAEESRLWGEVALGTDQTFALGFTTTGLFSHIIGSYKLNGSFDLKEMAGLILDEEQVTALKLPVIRLEKLDVFFVSTGAVAPMVGRSWLLGFRISLEVKKILAAIPLIGQVLADKMPFSINELIVVYAMEDKQALQPLSEIYDKETVQSLFIDRLGLDGRNTAYTAISNGVNIFTDLRTGDAATETKEDTSNNNSGNQITVTPPPKKQAAQPAPPVTGSDGITWKTVDADFLGVKVKRVGYKLGEGFKSISFFLDANMSVSVMSLQLRGLEIYFDIALIFKKFPEIRLSGLGLAYKNGPIEISGAFLSTQQEININTPQAPEWKKITVYQGAAIIRLQKISIMAIGSYASYQNKAGVQVTSLFIYGALLMPIGGDPAFFITGIAAGFGYNHRVRTPSIRDVKDFPLVSLVMGSGQDKTAMAVLDELVQANWIPVSEGDYWLAIGVRFDTYKLLDSFVLVIVQFGTRLELIIAGLSILRWPPGKKQVAYVELAILIRIASDSDVIAVEAMLTPNSWLLSEDCKLTGGFAMYIWIKGEHKGDFVVTLGGYHPRYQKPAHYPEVDRLGLSWKISNELSIRGEMYFALTSSCIMAGGRWEACYDTGKIYAYLCIWADLIMSWAPVYYELEAGVIVKVRAEIDLLLVKETLQLDIGAQIKLYGPPFAGMVRVKWKVLSFTIPFGNEEAAQPAGLSWDAFCREFLPLAKPADNNKDKLLVTPLTITINKGILQEKKEDADTIKEVNAQELLITIDSAMPVTTLTGQLNTSAGIQNKELGILPMKEKWQGPFTATLEAQLSYYDTATKAWKRVDDQFTLTPFTKNVPASLWKKWTPANTGVAKEPSQPELITTIGGLSLAPKPTNRQRAMVKLTPYRQVSKTIPPLPQPAITGKSNAAIRASLRTANQSFRGYLSKAGTGEHETKPNKKAEAWYALFTELNGELIDLKEVTSERKQWIESLRSEPVVCGTGQIPQFA